MKGRRSAGGSRAYACAHRPLPLTPGNHPGPRGGRAVCGRTSLRAPRLCSRSVSCMFSTRRANEQVLPLTRVAQASHLAQTWPSAPAAQQALPTCPDPARTEQPSLPPCSVPALCTPPPAPRGPRGPRAPPRSACAAAHTPTAPGRGVGAERGAGSHSAALEAPEMLGRGGSRHGLWVTTSWLWREGLARRGDAGETQAQGLRGRSEAPSGGCCKNLGRMH